MTTQLAPPRNTALDLPQYRLLGILGVWAAAALPMGALAWLVAPWLVNRLDGPQPLTQALLITLTAGLAWQLVLVLLLLRREQGRLTWSGIRDGLWLHAPTSPRSGRRGGRVWWSVVPYLLGFGLWTLVPSIPGPSPRDLGAFLESTAGGDFFAGSWGWFAVVVLLAVLNTALGEELLFRGLLLPRMQGVFGRGDWLANGVLFALYHLHTPWTIPSALSDSIFLAYPSSRFRSAWMGIVVHSTQSVVIIAAVLVAVLA